MQNDSATLDLQRSVSKADRSESVATDLTLLSGRESDKRALVPRSASSGATSCTVASVDSDNSGTEPCESSFTIVPTAADATPVSKGEAGRAAAPAITRERWSSRAEFILSVMGYAIGLGNVWRFPYLCYQNGGGTFLIPYMITVVFAGTPMFMLELALGQYFSVGGLGVWRICPLLKGVGYAALVVSFWGGAYYIVILVWGLYYFYSSFRSELPWAHCGQTWNTNSCRTDTELRGLRMSYCESNGTINGTYEMDANCTLYLSQYSSSAREFWERNVLSISGGIEQVGSLQWHLVICLVVMWIIIYFSIWKGVRWTGKVVYVTALAPYLLLGVLLVQGVLLPGAGTGIKYYLMPNITKLAEAKTWVDAATQVFFAEGIACGVLIAFGSYNHFNNNVYRQAITVSLVNNATAFFSGFVIFSVIGNMAHVQGKSIASVADSGPGLAFLVYPSAVAQMPLAPFWAALFFAMIFFVGVDSEFGIVEGFVTAIIDEWPRYLRGRREICLLVVCLVSCLVGLTNMTQGGMYIFQLLDTYCASGWILLWIAFLECIAVSWFYGINKFFENMKEMIGYYPFIWWKFAWTVTCPAMCAFVFVFSLVQYVRPVYMSYTYPLWGELLGWALALSSMLAVPVYALWVLWQTLCCNKSHIEEGAVLPSLREKFKALVRPNFESISARRKSAQIVEPVLKKPLLN